MQPAFQTITKRGEILGIADQLGKFVQAEGGTLFLDEVGELSATMQAKLLRVIQERVVDPLGGRQSIPIDIRLVAATNRSLEGEGFRVDLYHRLNVLPVEMPPLRERPEDIPLLARHFMEKASKANRKPAREIAVEAQTLLMTYGWPGNVRELQNLMERLVILGGDGPVQASELPASMHQKPAAPMTAKQMFLAVHQLALGTAIDLAKGNARKAAAIAGIHYKSFHRSAKRAGLRHKINPAASESG